MVSSFFGLETARRALQTQQIGLDVAGHNISNANTSGYTRQIANLKTTNPATIYNNGREMQVGSGVTVGQISRARDTFVDRQVRFEMSKQQYWTSKQEALQNIEAMLNEPTENSLRTDLDRFWNSWSDLSKDPESLAARTVVKERAISLVNSFQNISQHVDETQQNIDNTIRLQIKQINDYAKELAALNQQIVQQEANGGSPNDLYDQRDMVIDGLSKLVNVKIVEKSITNSSAKQVSVIIGDSAASPPQVLVNGGMVNLLKEYSIPAKEGESFATLAWENGSNSESVDQWGNTIKLGNTTGSLLASIETRGDQNGAKGYLADFMAQIDTLASGVASAVNELHMQGQDLNGDTGVAFFESSTLTAPISASTIRLNQDIYNDSSKIAAAANDTSGVNTGDGSIAQDISSLAEGWSALISRGIAGPVSASSFGAFYVAGISKIGADVQQAERMQEMQSALVTQVTNQREAVSAVSLDEEMVNLVKYQKSYGAAARMVTVIDSLLETIINGMGLTR